MLSSIAYNGPSFTKGRAMKTSYNILVAAACKGTPFTEPTGRYGAYGACVAITCYNASRF